jgi:hypothetical protein
MNQNLYSQVHFFDTLRDTIDSQPYAVLCSEEVNNLISQIDTLANKANARCSGFEHACALRQAVYNAKSDGYFPIIVLPQYKYRAAMLHLRVT